MPKKISYPINQYTRVLKKILNAASEHSYLWQDNDVRIELLHVVVDEQQGWEERYGLEKLKEGKITFYHDNCNNDYNNDDHRISLKRLSERIQKHDNHGANIPPDSLKQKFIDAMKEPIRRYITEKESIDERVSKKILSLEKMLGD